jgi:hypothetical protein
VLPPRPSILLVLIPTCVLGALYGLIIGTYFKIAKEKSLIL